MSNSIISSGSDGGRFAGDMLALLLIIVVGTVGAVWLLAMPYSERVVFFEKALSFATIIAAQPGIFLSYKIASNAALRIRTRAIWAGASVVVLGIAIPMALANWVHSALNPLL